MIRTIRRKVHDVRFMHTLFTRADELALADGADAAGPEHLVQSVIELPDGTARAAFEAVGGDAADFASAVTAQHRDALSGVGLPSELGEPFPDATLQTGKVPEGALRSTPAAQRLFRSVVDRVRAERGVLSGARILAAALEAEEGTVARAIAHMGLDRAALKQAAESESRHEGPMRPAGPDRAPRDR